MAIITFPEAETDPKPLMGLPPRTGFWLFLSGLFILAAGLPFSKFLMSVGQFVLLGGWLLAPALTARLKQFKCNTTALLLSAVFFLHLAGLLYSSDLSYGLEDVRKKIPLFLIPFLLVTGPTVSRVWLNRILGMFLCSLLIFSVVVFLALKGISIKEVKDVRDASMFISHIRFSMMLAMGFFLSLWLWTEKVLKFRFILLLLPLWFIVLLISMQAMTGICVLIISLLVISIRELFTGSKLNRSVAALFLAGTFGGLLWLGWIARQESLNLSQTHPFTLERISPSGERYQHQNRPERENGHLIWVNVAPGELARAWNSRSQLPFNGADLKGNELSHTLIRFLSSKGLKKDSAAIASLSNKEIAAIEQGTANVNYVDASPVRMRISKLLWELDQYKHGRDPNGHSLTMRREFRKAGMFVFLNNPVLGVGTGDVRTAFAQAYIDIDSPLTEQWRLRAHNQFLEIAVAFGIVGLLLFILSLFYPLIKHPKFNFNLYLAFFTITFLSFFADDTLETQAGVTFYTFFNGVLLFCGREQKTTVHS